MKNSDFAPALEGKPNVDDFCRAAAVTARDEAVRVVADHVLLVLRHARDTAPTEWDALTASEAGPQLLNLWDFLRAKANP